MFIIFVERDFSTAFKGLSVNCSIKMLLFVTELLTNTNPTKWRIRFYIKTRKFRTSQYFGQSSKLFCPKFLIVVLTVFGLKLSKFIVRNFNVRNSAKFWIFMLKVYDQLLSNTYTHTHTHTHTRTHSHTHKHTRSHTYTHSNHSEKLRLIVFLGSAGDFERFCFVYLL